jgi:hypothetical protein
MAKKAQEILENIVRLAELLDAEAIKQLADIPFVELAKAVSIGGAHLEEEAKPRKKAKGALKKIRP